MKLTLMLLTSFFCAFLSSMLYAEDNVKKEYRAEIIVTPPKGFTAEDTMHIVGNFNQWTFLGEQATPLEFEAGKLTADILVSDKDVFYTFVKNKDWQHMPASLEGKSLCVYYNRLEEDLNVISPTVPSWKTDKPTIKAQTSITGDVRYLNDFAMPQFNRKVDIAIYLPKSYSNSKDKKYPVLYMLDGQNVFDFAESYSDEWGVDEILTDLEASKKEGELIVVAVPNSADRKLEYNPWDFINNDGDLVKGKGALTMDFIVSTLKPYIDANFKTHALKAGLAGSSLGGQMALYAAMEHGDTFDFVAAFSPGFDSKNSAGESLVFEAVKRQKKIKSKVYFDMGKIEYSGYTEVEELLSLLNTKADSVKLVKDDLGRHCEVDWAKRFPGAIQWWLSGVEES